MYDINLIIEKVKNFMQTKYHSTIKKANTVQMYNAVSQAIMSQIAPHWVTSENLHNNSRRAYYFSAEFLVGRAIFNNLICLGLYEPLKNKLKQEGFDINRFEEIDDDALGNGGLGRLAACFLDSAATLNIPLDGYGIRYKFGMFKQIIKNGFQVEIPDDWTKYGDPWSIRRENLSVKVKFSDQTVVAVPYDMPIIGYMNNNIGTLRLWQSEPINPLDLIAFNNGDYFNAVKEKNAAELISNVLYPNDNSESGKILRLKQQYFFCSASIKDIIRNYKIKYDSNFTEFSNAYAIQLNDTHPVISIAELIRILCEEEYIPFEDALKIAKETFAYTNHTILAEALEKWPIQLFKSVIPNVVKYIELIQKRFENEMNELSIDKSIIHKISPISNDTVYMANLAVYGSKFTNGVAKIHTEILKNSELKEWYSIFPDKFQNKTNGITQRRWLLLCNNELSKMITYLLGNDNWVTNLMELKNLKKFSDDSVMIKFMQIKLKKHVELAEYIKSKDGITINPNTIFDVQIKRMHEYKRQLLNVLSILHIYFEIKDGNLIDFNPTTFIFGAKAAPGYFRAKAIIKLINSLSELIDKDPVVNKFIKVIFISNYNVSYAEKIIAATDISEQISTAGTEASGTGNMKFMLNGAVTLGTYDGANVEIVEEAGKDNNYIFGKTVEEIKELSENYDPKELYLKDSKIKRVLDSLDNGLLNDNSTQMFKELKNSILEGSSWHKPDHYFLLADFHDYVSAKLKTNKDYSNKISFAKKCWSNIVNAGKFSSDRTIFDYAKNIWNLSN